MLDENNHPYFNVNGKSIILSLLQINVFVSIVVTVKNEAKSIAELLDSLVVQEGPFEIIIVDAKSDDGTREIVEDYKKIMNKSNSLFMGEVEERVEILVLVRQREILWHLQMVDAERIRTG